MILITAGWLNLAGKEDIARLVGDIVFAVRQATAVFNGRHSDYTKSYKHINCDKK